ncbi:unnamed protein product [Schistosoma intercalatum]|nr:unnamed protein product [Schistosoma intercalatum]
MFKIETRYLGAKWLNHLGGTALLYQHCYFHNWMFNIRGDCGAVIGSYSPPCEVPVTIPSSIDIYTQTSGEYTREHWEAKLLIPPHISENEADVRRIKSSHPVHEAEFIIRDDRLLGFHNSERFPHSTSIC